MKDKTTNSNKKRIVKEEVYCSRLDRIETDILEIKEELKRVCSMLLPSTKHMQKSTDKTSIYKKLKEVKKN